MTPHGDCPTCNKQEKARMVANGEIKRARDIVVGDIIKRPFWSKNRTVNVRSVEVTPKGKIMINKGERSIMGEDILQPEQWVDICKPTAREHQCLDDSCEQSHCAKCGSHMLGGYLEHGTVCDSCTLAIEQGATHVTCTIHPDLHKVKVFRYGIEIGSLEYIDGEPTLSLFPGPGGTQRITLNDISIIGDNWNQMHETIREEQPRG
jgi:hypothetical protein